MPALQVLQIVGMREGGEYGLRRCLKGLSYAFYLSVFINESPIYINKVLRYALRGFVGAVRLTVPVPSHHICKAEIITDVP